MASTPNTWQLGKPDLILTMPQFHTVPPDGEVQTVHFVFPLRLAEPRYLRGSRLCRETAAWSCR
jgi:hypothetical protein